jgi:hypothetical protein
MGEELPFGSSAYFMLLAVLLFGRSMDFLSTWVGSPKLVLEGNPIARKLGWKWGLLVNAAICLLVARWPLPAIIIATMSVLLAARNLELGWLMRSLGEEGFRDWFLARRAETPLGLYLFCVYAQGGLLLLVGVVLMLTTGAEQVIPFGIGMGIVTFALAVLVYTMLALWRNRRRAHF